MKAQSAILNFTFSRGASFSMPVYDDRQALNGLRDLDSQAIGAIYDQLYPEVYRYILYRLGDQSVAEDLASDVFVRLLEAVQHKRGPQTNLKGWLISTASHAVADHLRRIYRRPTEMITDSIPDLGPGPQNEFDLREQSNTVQQAYAQLTIEQQEVLALRFNQGYSLEETAHAMKKNVNAVKALQFRALAALQRQIDEVDYE
ncbi:MAG: sigma-70 family RNA polymerase sigma factor [Anaerolineales bacterium]|nr:sigma-70 family RNA polymerase sigma factor [Anaerolineales bacterium]